MTNFAPAQFRPTSNRRAMPYDRAKRMAGDASPLTRQRLAARGDVQPEILFFLSEDADAGVRRAVAANKNSPVQADQALIRDSDDEVRFKLAHKIARLAPQLDEEEQGRIGAAVFEILDVLARDELPRVRRILSDELSHAANVPATVIEHLARDRETEIAAKVLEFSPLLSDEVLAEIIASRPVQGALPAISRRHGLSGDICDAIVEIDDEKAITALLSNDSAQIREETLDRLIDRAADVPEWHAPLVRRPALSPQNIVQLTQFVADSLLDELVARSDIDSGTARTVARAVRTRLQHGAGAAGSGPAGTAGDLSPQARAERMRSDGTLDEAAVLDALGKGDRVFATAALAALAGAPVEVVQKAVSLESAKGLTALAWKAGLGMRAAVQLQLRLAHIAPDGVLRPKDGTEYPMTVEDMRWQIEFFGA
jgi:uncharacterized protein (DUF2336 family)